MIEIFLAVFTGLLVLVGSIQAWFLWCAFQATREAADAATKNSDTLIRQNSPYLRFSSFNLADEKPPVVRHIFRNYGGGRAFLKEINTKLLLISESLPNVPEYEGASFQFIPAGTTLGTMDALPPVTQKLPEELNTMAGVSNALLNGHLFVYGFVVYSDVLTQRHTFGFTYEYINGRFVEAGGQV